MKTVPRNRNSEKGQTPKQRRQAFVRATGRRGRIVRHEILASLAGLFCANGHLYNEPETLIALYDLLGEPEQQAIVQQVPVMARHRGAGLPARLPGPLPAVESSLERYNAAVSAQMVDAMKCLEAAAGVMGEAMRAGASETASAAVTWLEIHLSGVGSLLGRLRVLDKFMKASSAAGKRARRRNS